LLADCKRVLIPGGVLCVAVPDARIWIGAYTRGEAIDSRKYLNGYQIPCPYGRIDLINFMAYMDGSHKYLFDDENLLNVLRAAGFRNVQLRLFDPMIDVASRQFESLYAQCYK
jgi:predicted SAM-dependent methyltransferase